MASRTQQLKSSAKKSYTVRRGDTLASIARKFDVDTADIMRWNKLKKAHIEPGDKLKILDPDKA
jgi:membrane-bound lytic murein transglycosylase D